MYLLALVCCISVILLKRQKKIFFCLSNKISCIYLVALFDIRLYVNSFGSCLYLFNLFVMQVVLEASVGSTGMSDIAVDDVTFVQGPCPGMSSIRYISSL